MAVMIVKALKLDMTAEEISFSDKTEISGWARNAVATVVKRGVIKGYPDTTYKPAGNATRAEAATAILQCITL